MTRHVHLLGLDFGSTTSCALVARARIASSIVGRMALSDPEVVYRSEPVFTPFSDDSIAERRVAQLLDRWITDSGVPADGLFGGGTLITGLAARRHNAEPLARAVAARVGDAVVATASDPRLESWLAFMGSCSLLSRAHAQTPILNLDIGGGTTNAALGTGGNVSATGCWFIGARHFRFEPGTYRLLGWSDFGAALLSALGARPTAGAEMDEGTRHAVLDYYVRGLEAIARSDARFFQDALGRLHEAAPLNGPAVAELPAITFSGGVGELVYRHASGTPLPGTTYFGDLGIDLALRIAGSSLLAKDVSRLVPDNRGRATVYGLTLHSTEVSGSTLFLPRPELLPMRDLPIVARIPVAADEAVLRDAIALARSRTDGACIQILGTASSPSRLQVKALGERLAALLRASPSAIPLVLLAPHDIGKTLGSYATDWGQVPADVIVIDEMPDRHAHFANLGRPHDNVVPVSFYGMQ